MIPERVMTFGETWQAIRDGDVRIATAFALECLIILSPFAILGAAIWLGINR